MKTRELTGMELKKLQSETGVAGMKLTCSGDTGNGPCGTFGDWSDGTCANGHELMIREEFYPSSIEQAAQISAAWSLVGVRFTYNGGRSAVAGALDGSLRETRFTASFPDARRLDETVCDCIMNLRSKVQNKQAYSDQMDRDFRSALNNADRLDGVDEAKRALKTALVAAYGEV